MFDSRMRWIIWIIQRGFYIDLCALGVGLNLIDDKLLGMTGEIVCRRDNDVISLAPRGHRTVDVEAGLPAVQSLVKAYPAGAGIGRFGLYGPGANPLCACQRECATIRDRKHLVTEISTRRGTRICDLILVKTFALRDIWRVRDGIAGHASHGFHGDIGIGFPD